MTSKLFCDKCKHQIFGKGVTVYDTWDLCYDCVGLFGEWLDK